MIVLSDAVEGDIDRLLEIERGCFSPPWSHGALLGEVYREDSFFAVARVGKTPGPAGPPSFAKEGRGNALLGNGAEKSPSPSGLCPEAAPSLLKWAETGVVGFVVLRCVGDVGELLQVAVVEAARGRGVGGVLVGAALGFAGERSLGSVFLEVRASNAVAIRLYERFGFVPVSRRMGYYECPVEDAVVMERGGHLQLIMHNS